MQPYTYYLHHIPTNQHYYGVRTARNCNPSELWITYFSTSKLVWSLREQYGDASFKYEVRRLFKTVKEALEWETRFLTRIDAANRVDWLNQHNGGNKFSTAGKVPWNKGVTHSVEARRKISLARKKYVGELHPMYGKLHTNESKRLMSEHRSGKCVGENNPFYGKHHSDELKHMISEQNAGENNWMFGKEGRFKGKKHSIETRNRMSETRKGKYTGENNPMYGKHHSEATLQKIRGHIPWNKGKRTKQL